jgi:Protein of unknown function (DUF3306)
MSGDFLSRWSRRKLDTRAPPESTPEPQPDPAPAEPDLTPEEIAALPKPDELTPETDLTVFFRKGVPELLRNAALRRMWSLDPAIRDHVGDARDYAYDWNVPGGVPGNGPLLPTDDVDAMVRQVFGERDAADSDVPQRQDAPRGVETSSHDRDDAPRPGEDAERTGAVEEGAAPRDPEPAPAAAAPEEGPKGQAPPELPAAARGAAAPPPGVVAAPPVRRHGRARPV